MRACALFLKLCKEPGTRRVLHVGRFECTSMCTSTARIQAKTRSPTHSYSYTQISYSCDAAAAAGSATQP